MHTTLLEIIEINREALMLSSNSAMDLLRLIHKNYDGIADEECIISLSLNDSIAKMVYYADYAGATANSRATLAAYPRSSQIYYTTRHLALIGRCLTLSGQFAAGEEALHRALTKAKPILNTSREMTKVHVDILHDLAMNNDMSQGVPETSMRYLEKALTLLEKTDLAIRKGICLMGLGNVSYGNKDIESALAYYLVAANIFEEEANMSNLANASSNIGLCYTDLGKLKVAESHLIRSLNLRKSMGNPEQIANSHHNLSRVYASMGDIKNALICMIACRDLSRNSLNKYLYNIATEWIAACPISETDIDNSAAQYYHGLNLKVA